jgi:hypothetical protein
LFGRELSFCFEGAVSSQPRVNPISANPGVRRSFTPQIRHSERSACRIYKAPPYSAARSRRTPKVSALPIRYEPFSLYGWGEVATVLVEKGRTATARQNASGFFDSAPRKVRETLRSE